MAYCRADELFAELRHAIPKPDKQSACQNSWISEETWILISERVSTRREPGRDQRCIRRLGWAIRDYIKEDMRWRVTTEGEAAESLLNGDPALPREDWRKIRGGTEKRWITPHRLLKSHLSGSRQSVRIYTALYPAQGRQFPYPCHPPQSTPPYLHRRRSSGR